MWEKKKVWIVTIWLKDEDDEGEPLNWSNPSEEYYADTLEEAEKMKERFLSGKDEYYGNSIEDCWISDEMEEREFLKINKHLEGERPSVLNKLQDAKQTAASQNVTEHTNNVKQRKYEKAI